MFLVWALFKLPTLETGAAVMAAKQIEALLANPLDAWRKGKPQEVGQTEHDLGIAMRVS